MQLVVAHERPEMHLLGSSCELLYFCLILFVFAQLFLKALLTLNGVKAVSAAVKLGLAVVNFNAALGDAVEEKAVVADGKHRALKVQQVLLEPLRCTQVEVICRLVKQQNVGVLKDETGKIHSCAFASGQ